jgi:dinuclear metal center YbgI/SA1388 family protein
MLVRDVLMMIDGVFPFVGATEGDPVGLQLGGADREAGRVAVCHEASGEVVDRVVASGINTLISYHPLLFVPTTSLVEGESAEGRALRLAEAGTSLVIVHTAMDAAHPGTGDAFLSALGYTASDSFGRISDDDPPIGRITYLDSPLSGTETVAAVETVTGRSARAALTEANITTLAVLPGSGAFAIEQAAPIADVLITGDVSHHQARRAIEFGLMIVDAGHAATERPGVASLYDSVSEHVHEAELIEDDPTPWEA